MEPISIILPWPPTSNTYWRRNGSRYFISAKGEAFRQLAFITCAPFRNHFKADDKLIVSILAYPPDKRRRDLDNIFKCTLDALQFSRVYVDDNQIDNLSIKRMLTIENKIIIDLVKY